MVWEVFALTEAMISEQMKVVLENCRFIRASTIPKEGDLQLTVMIQSGTGNFEVIEGDVPVVKGNIRKVEDDDSEMQYHKLNIEKNNSKMTTKDIYKELRIRGYNYTGAFRAIEECNVSVTDGLIKWEDNWISFIDNMFQMKILQIDTRLLYVPIKITKLTIDAKKHRKYINSLGENPSVPVRVFEDADLIK